MKKYFKIEPLFFQKDFSEIKLTNNISHQLIPNNYNTLSNFVCSVYDKSISSPFYELFLYCFVNKLIITSNSMSISNISNDFISNLNDIFKKALIDSNKSTDLNLSIQFIHKDSIPIGHSKPIIKEQEDLIIINSDLSPNILAYSLLNLKKNGTLIIEENFLGGLHSKSIIYLLINSFETISIFTPLTSNNIFIVFSKLTNLEQAIIHKLNFMSISDNNCISSQCFGYQFNKNIESIQKNINKQKKSKQKLKLGELFNIWEKN